MSGEWFSIFKDGGIFFACAVSTAGQFLLISSVKLSDSPAPASLSAGCLGEVSTQTLRYLAPNLLAVALGKGT